MSNPPTKTANDGAASVLRVCAATLEIKRGPDAGRKVRVEQPAFVIGTGEGADLRLSDRTVSREHLTLHLTPAGVELRDEGSKNGTHIGKMRVGRVTVSSDTVLEVGSTTIALALERDPIDLPLSASARFGDALGISAAMRHLFATLEPVAKSSTTVLLEGESGVGKEVLARALHARSDRAKGPFVVVDCGAIPPTLIESELFGHEKGAFTGATEERRGLFEDASGGTLFLDEVGELPLDLQPKLLRALEQREVRPVGGRTRKVDVRVVAATNRRLAEAVRSKEFRQDLFYRLAVVRVTVPPLRDRPEDIEPLATAFLRAHKGDPTATLSPDLVALLVHHTWPGNVRELRNVIERYAVVGAAGLLDDTDRASPESGEALSRLPYHEARKVVVERFERDYIPRILARAGGVVARAADQAELARPSLYRMMDRLGISRRDED